MTSFKESYPPTLTEATIHRARAKMPRSISAAQNGVRKISFEMLSPPDSSSASSRSSSVTVDDNPSTTRVVAVPVNLYSPQSYQFLGFTSERAEKLWELFKEIMTNGNALYEADQEDPGVLFSNLAQDTVKYNGLDTQDSEEDWYAAMQRVGICEELQQAIMTPCFENVRLTATLGYWLREILHTNFHSLQTLNSRIIEMLDSADTASLRGGQGDPPTPITIPKDHTVLWRATAKDRIEGLFQSDGTMDFSVQGWFSLPPTDFANFHGAWYFTAQKVVADEYARFALHTCVAPDIRTVQLIVPNSFLGTLKRLDLKPNDQHWKELIWYSHTAGTYPKEWRKEYSRVELVYGPIARHANEAYKNLSSWEKIIDKNVFKTADGDVGYQYVFTKMRTMEALAEELKGKVYLHKTYSDMKIVPEPWKA